MTHKRNRKPYLITSEVAVILKCSVDEVRRLETDGEIVAVRTRAGTGISTPRPSRPYRRRRTAPHRKSIPGKTEPARPERRPLARGEPLPSELDEILDEEEARRALAEEQAPPPPPLPPPTIFDYARLSMLRMHGTLCIAFDVPPEWHEKVTDDLERFITYERFPPTADLLDAAAHTAIEARVADVLAPYHKEAARARDAEQRRQALITYGRDHARHITTTWDFTSGAQARSEVDRVLRAEVKPTMTEREVRLMVDEILEKYSEDNEA